MSIRHRGKEKAQSPLSRVAHLVDRYNVIAGPEVAATPKSPGKSSAETSPQAGRFLSPQPMQPRRRRPTA
jgi:hypothetical protein